MKRLLSPLRIASVYGVFGALWILLSDTALHVIVANPDLEARLQTYKGWAYVAVTAALVYWLTSRYAKMMRVGIDEEERVKTELSESERRLSRHIQNTPLGCVSWDRDFVCIEWNKAAEKIFGYPADEAIGRPAADFLIPGQIGVDLDAVFQQLLAQTGGSKNTNENMTRDGRTILCEWYNTPIFNPQGDVTGISSLVLDITEKKRAEDLMLKAKEDALKANKAKSEFLATMSHEFRTPLNAIIGFSEMMRPEYSGKMDPDRYVAYAADIHQSGQHMLSLVNDVLDVSEIEAGERRIRKEPVDVRRVLEACLTNLEPAARKAGVTMALEIENDPPTIMADIRSVSQIALNLLSNAVKFTDVGGSAVLRVRASEDDVTIEVSDTGVGIPADKIAGICEPFSRLDRDPHMTQLGTGLGLSIVKALVDAHGGTLSIESELGVGTSVTFTLPRVGRE